MVALWSTQCTIAFVVMRARLYQRNGLTFGPPPDQDLEEARERIQDLEEELAAATRAAAVTATDNQELAMITRDQGRISQVSRESSTATFGSHACLNNKIQVPLRRRSVGLAERERERDARDVSSACLA